ncbi:MAG: hypothetical protein HIU93_15170 [Acidobacteria bacterium]|nr:hypothetical protein [Acidobacteriota bacterium]MBW4044334.1 hypothetical protein [Acidobacteriota bacterium]
MAHVYQYNAEGRLKSVDASSSNQTIYYYDGLGRRVRKESVDGQVTEYTYLGLGGTVLSIKNPNAGTQWTDFISTGGPQFAMIPGTQNAAPEYRMLDHLGSLALLADNAGNVIGSNGYAPYGQLLPGAGISQSVDAFQFTGHERDYEDATDATLYRQYSPIQGRFLSPDPYMGSYDLTNPQSFNRYSYVGNMPMAFTDLLGLDPCSQPSYDGVPCIFSNSGGSSANAGSSDFISLFIDIGEIIDSLFGFGGPSFHGSLKPRPQAPSKSITTCAANFADKYSIAGGLHSLGIGNSGVGGFITNALGGNAFSGATNLISSFGSGSAGGHSVFYNMGQSLMAGPLQGIPGGNGPWGASASDLATGAIAGGAFSAVTGAGQTLQGLNGTASLASTGLDAAEFASGVGLVKFGYDGLSYLAGLAHCAQ